MRATDGRMEVPELRPLTDVQERALIALDALPYAGTVGPEGKGWHLASEIRCGVVTDGRFTRPTWYRLYMLGLVGFHESSNRALEVRITEAGVAMLRSMGD